MAPRLRVSPVDRSISVPRNPANWVKTPVKPSTSLITPVSSRALRRLAACCAFLALALPSVASAVTAPYGFVIENAVPGSNFDTPVSFAFLPDGRMFVAEKRGRVIEVQNGVASPGAVWQGENEVLNIDDRGLLSVAVDPHYFLNHYIYLLYAVDPDSDGVDLAGPAFGRLTRYQVSFTDSAHVDPASRTILMGVDWSHGPPTGSPSHTIGGLRWGEDGTLLVSIGEGAAFTDVDAGGQHPTMFGPGRTAPAEDIGAFRSQYIGSLAGKILRLDPATGHGLPSNPFWNGDPTSVQSRVWVYGLRNPYRYTVRPGSGMADPAAGHPGTLFIGDVGWNSYEELNIASAPGFNFGWPCREGNKDQAYYPAATPSHCGCDSTLTAHNPSPRREPDMTWHHQWGDLSVPQGLVGNCSVSGAFYMGTQYPLEYRNRLFFSDFGQNWIRVVTIGANEAWSNVQDFATGAEGPVDMAANPVNGDLYSASIYTNEIRRIRFSGDPNNHRPVAVATATPAKGVVPLPVSFSSAGTADADNDPLALGWSFGDGFGSTQANPAHTYTSPGIYRAILTVDDGRGGVGRDTLVVTVTDSLETFPTTLVVDDFSRPDGPIGGAWVPESPGLEVSGSGLTMTAPYNSAVWDGGVFGANQEAFMTLRNLATAAPENDLMLKVQGLIWSAGYVEVRYDATRSDIRVSTYTAGAGWIGHGSPIPVTMHDGDQLGARVDSLGQVSVFVNGITVGSASVADWPYATLGGRIGFILVGSGSNHYDDFGGGNVVEVTNTAPSCSILSPTDGTFYTVGDTITLVGVGSDHEQAAASLTYRWQIDMHHNTHVHPSSMVLNGPSGSFIAENHDDGTGIHLECLLIVTDQGGLRDTSRVELFPDVDLEPATLAGASNTLSGDAPTPFSFVLRNRGSMPAPFSHWEATLEDGTTLASGDTAIAPFDSVIVSTMLPIVPTPGAHTLRIVADTLGTVTEPVESNNAIMVPIEVLAPGTLDAPSARPRLALSMPYPNPTTRAVSLALELPLSSRVEFDVIDIQGRVVWSQIADSRVAGRWTLRWPGVSREGAVARPGVYLARVRAGGLTWSRRIALIH